MKRQQSIWRVYRVANLSGKRTDLAECQAWTGLEALEGYAEAHGLSGVPQGRAGYAVVGTGLLRAERIKTRTADEDLPSIAEMRAVLAARDHNDANLISDVAVELRYRANVLGERMLGPGGELDRAASAPNGALAARPHTASDTTKGNNMASTAAPAVENDGADLAKTLVQQMKAEIDGVKVIRKKSYERFAVGKQTVAVASLTSKGALTVEVPVGAKRRPAEKFTPKAESDLAGIVAASKKAVEAAAK